MATRGTPTPAARTRPWSWARAAARSLALGQRRLPRGRQPPRLRRHGGRKPVIVPEGLPEPAPRRPDDTMVKALARAWRWKRMIETGKVRSLNDIAEAEKLNSSYVSRIFRLTLLAPDIVEAILAGRQPRTLQLEMLREDVPVEWHKQREMFGFVPS